MDSLITTVANSLGQVETDRSRPLHLADETAYYTKFDTPLRLPNWLFALPRLLTWAHHRPAEHRIIRHAA